MQRVGRSEPLRVAVLWGGESPEREVSLASGLCVAAALEAAGHAVRGIDPVDVPLGDVDWHAFDACFIALHGGAGEDGRVQQFLSARGVPYTGSGPEASRRAMSKSWAKAIWRQVGVPTPAFLRLGRGTPTALAARLAAKTDGSLVVKPDAQGSSLGVHTAEDLNQLQRCIAAAQQFGPDLLIEPLVKGQEYTVAVLGRHPLPPLRIDAQGPIFSYHAKYRSPDATRCFDTDLATAPLRRVQATAVAAAKALTTAGLVRVDLILDASGVPQVLEINTVPGMTNHSLAPRAAARTGLDMPALCDRLVRACLPAEDQR